LIDVSSKKLRQILQLIPIYSIGGNPLEGVEQPLDWVELGGVAYHGQFFASYVLHPPSTKS